MYQKAPTGVAYSTAIPPKFFSVKKVILLLAMILEAARTIVYMIIVTARAGELLKHLKPANTKENRVSGGVLFTEAEIINKFHFF